ncbi:MAG: hypothetical protein AAFP04_01790 [Myxococcota bacterium]
MNATLSRRLRRETLVVVAVLGVAQGACTSVVGTQYQRVQSTPTELSLAYGRSLEVHQAEMRLTKKSDYGALIQVVRCHDVAREHAEGAQRNKRRAAVLRGLGVLTGLGSLSGFAALGIDDQQQALTVAGIGAGLATLSLIFSTNAKSRLSHAHGHTVDAVNHWNDAMGFAGQSCDAP